jgi:hypothetical protein
VIWGFVDYENTGSLETFNGSDYERIFVFCGPNNTKLKLGKLSSTEFSRIELIGVKTTGSNNLDFHLAFYLGKFHESAEKEIEFHVISNDTGFNGIISHLKKIGRKAKRIPTRKPAPKKKANGAIKKTKTELSEYALLVARRLKAMDDKKRPGKKTPLMNWIKSQCNHIEPKVSPEQIYKELMETGNIKPTNSTITYHIKC